MRKLKREQKIPAAKPRAPGRKILCKIPLYFSRRLVYNTVRERCAVSHKIKTATGKKRDRPSPESAARIPELQAARRDPPLCIRESVRRTFAPRPGEKLRRTRATALPVTE